MLGPRLRQSIPARISAIGFIIVIICGNLWLAEAMLGQIVPHWIVYGFLGGTAITLVGAAFLLALAVYLRLVPKDEPQ